MRIAPIYTQKSLIFSRSEKKKRPHTEKIVKAMKEHGNGRSPGFIIDQKGEQA
ncbi:MAG: hypothetical protein GF311_14750 [Candidatus Lokiarchaeota archaeon]|nr:hypothetical protein [Candidatus Lokiarchaeota archaeon]